MNPTGLSGATRRDASCAGGLSPGRWAAGKRRRKIEVRGPQIDAIEEFLGLIAKNSLVVELAQRAPLLGLPDTWVVSGCLFQTAWNVLSGQLPTRGIKDYDLFYFDSSDLSAESEADVNRRGAECFADLQCEIDIRNQARVHTWYEKEFGVSGYPRLSKSTDGIDNFLAVCCMVAIRRNEACEFDVYSPFGVEDILNRVVRPNPWYPNVPVEFYNLKAQRWSAMWPELKIEPIESVSGTEFPAQGVQKRDRTSRH